MNQKEEFKVAIAHPFQQHSYKIAEAFEIGNISYDYFTSIYIKEKTITNKLKFLLNPKDKQRANSRTSNLINPDNVYLIGEFNNLILLLLKRLAPNSKITNKWEKFFVKRFNKKLYKKLIKNKYDVLITFDMFSYDIYKKLDKTNNIRPVKIIDMSAPNRIYVNEILNEYKLNKKIEVNNSQKNTKELEKTKFEIMNADYYLAASKFTVESLLYSGVNKNDILYLPYGIDIDEKILNKKEEKNINFAFVGRHTIDKGIYDLINVINDIEYTNVFFNFYGSKNDLKEDQIKNKSNIKFYGHLPKQQLLEKLGKNDYLVFPTLYDGFGMVVLEAFSKGIPVICSRNAGASDLIRDGYNGFLYDAGDTDRLKVIMEQCIRDNPNYKVMSSNSFETAKENKWNVYRESLIDFINEIKEKI